MYTFRRVKRSVLKLAVCIAAALAIHTHAFAAEQAHPPLSISCGAQLPVAWEQGAVFRFEADGVTALVTPQMLSQGVSLMIGRWSRDAEGYLVIWRAAVMRDGSMRPASVPLRVGRFLLSQKTQGGYRTLEMRGQKRLQCLVE